MFPLYEDKTTKAAESWPSAASERIAAHLAELKGAPVFGIAELRAKTPKGLLNCSRSRGYGPSAGQGRFLHGPQGGP